MLSFSKTDKELRKFGFIFLIYMVFLSLIFFKLFHYNVSILFWLIFVVAILALLKPKAILPLNIIWDVILSILHWINTRMLFGTVFFFIFYPIAFLRRVFRKDTLDLCFKSNKSTYRINIVKCEKNDLRKPY